jgi:hypothetical protein
MSRRTALLMLLVVALTSSPMAVSAAPSAPQPEPAGAAASNSPAPESPAAFPLVTSADPVVRWMVDQVSQETARRYDGDLSGAWPVTVGTGSYTIMTRYTRSGTHLRGALNYVSAHLEALGLTVTEQAWSSDASNIIGEKTGLTRPGDIYLVSAHLDDTSEDALDIAPGSDDNASGVTGVLITADLLAQFSWNCTLRFAFWTGEEQGLYGSEAYAKEAKTKGENIVGVLNLDMIGWNTPGSRPDIDLHAKSAMPGTVELANQMASVIGVYELDLVPEVRTDGNGQSDHASFWKYGFNAILGIEDFYPNESDFDPYYHSTADTLSTLDLGYLTEYVKAAAAETAHMANCMVTGNLEGSTIASHDQSRIPNAKLELADTAGRQYSLQTGADGSYAQALPLGTYSARILAYGYAEGETTGLEVFAGSSSSQDFELTAAAPAVTAAAISLDAGEARLTWPHVSPDVAYQVHRSTHPYFGPATDTRLATLEANHSPAVDEMLTHRDAGSGAGDATTNHFYAVVGLNAAGSTAFAGWTGEFDFQLEPGTSAR